MRLEAEIRDRVEEFVRPLYTGLDGVQTFDRVGRIEGRLRELAGGQPVNEQLLELLVLFQGVIERLGSLGRQSRFGLFLRGLSLPEELSEAVRTGLRRFSDLPETAEERLLHDACLLEKTGLRAAVARLLTAGRRRWTVERALEALDPGPAEDRFHTPAGAAMAARHRRKVEVWIEELRRSIRGEKQAS